MTLGVPREIKTQEHRVGLLPSPSAVFQLTRRGHQVIVEQGAGVVSGYPYEGYAQASAKLVVSHEEPFLRAEWSAAAHGWEAGVNPAG